MAWDHLGVATSTAPWRDARAAAHAEARKVAAKIVLRHVFAGHRERLDGAPEDLIERCVAEPETVRAWIG